MSFESHHLELREVWFIREHPFDKRVVEVKRIIKELDAHELAAEQLRAQLEVAVSEMNAKRDATKLVDEQAQAVPVRRRVVS